MVAQTRRLIDEGWTGTCDMVDTAGLEADHVSLQQSISHTVPRFLALMVTGQLGRQPQSPVLFCTPGIVSVTPSYSTCGTINKTFLLPAEVVAHQWEHAVVSCEASCPQYVPSQSFGRRVAMQRLIFHAHHTLF